MCTSNYAAQKCCELMFIKVKNIRKCMHVFCVAEYSTVCICVSRNSCGNEDHSLQLYLHPDATHITYVYILPSSQELNVLRPKAGFRLWLTAEIHPRFPPILLQSSLKITYEVHTNTYNACSQV